MKTRKKCELFRCSLSENCIVTASKEEHRLFNAVLRVFVYVPVLYSLAFVFFIKYHLSLVPVIEKHPESCTVQLGRDCKLFCHVTGKNLKYRWYRRSRCLEGEVN